MMPCICRPCPLANRQGGVPTHRLHRLMSRVKDRGQSIHNTSLLILQPRFHEEDAPSPCHICLLQFQSTEHRMPSLDSLKAELPLLSHPSPVFGSSVRPFSLQRPALARSWGGTLTHSLLQLAEFSLFCKVPREAPGSVCIVPSV